MLKGRGRAVEAHLEVHPQFLGLSAPRPGVPWPGGAQMAALKSSLLLVLLVWARFLLRNPMDLWTRLGVVLLSGPCRLFWASWEDSNSGWGRLAGPGALARHPRGT